MSVGPPESGHLAARLSERLVAVGCETDAGAIDRLERWLALHGKWSRVANLTGTRDVNELVDLHLMDSAAVAARLLEGSLLDVGSGSGLPGLVIAALQPARSVTVLDAAQKRTRFLAQAVLDLGLQNVDVVTARCEEWRPERRPDWVVARAVAPLVRLVSWTSHLLDQGAHLLAMKGPAWEEEASALPGGYRVTAVTPYDVPGTDRAHVLVEIECSEVQGEG